MSCFGGKTHGFYYLVHVCGGLVSVNRNVCPKRKGRKKWVGEGRVDLPQSTLEDNTPVYFGKHLTVFFLLHRPVSVELLQNSWWKLRRWALVGRTTAPITVPVQGPQLVLIASFIVFNPKFSSPSVSISSGLSGLPEDMSPDHHAFSGRGRCTCPLIVKIEQESTEKHSNWPRWWFSFLPVGPC